MQHQKPRLDSINDRALEFACRVIDPFLPSLPDRPEVRRIVDQLVGASGGIGSNLEEAQAASSRREFVRYCEIALREGRETIFWLRVCQRTKLGHQPVCNELLDEGLQIARIIAASSSTPSATGCDDVSTSALVIVSLCRRVRRAQTV
jgi:four helix bundle protein